MGHWRDVYRDRFIPFAHGVRRLGTVYADRVRPADPFEFVELLRGEDLRAANRNDAIGALCDRVRAHPELAAWLRSGSPEPRDGAPGSRDRGWWEERAGECRSLPGGNDFAEDLDRLLATDLDVVWGGERLADRPDLLIAVVLASVDAPDRPHPAEPGRRAELERRFLAAADRAGQGAHARQVLATARTSWRLRDDDNLLLGRLEAEILRAIREAAGRLAAGGRRTGGPLGEGDAPRVAEALRDPSIVVRGHAPEAAAGRPGAAGGRGAVVPRQLVGSPAAPGLASGPVRLVRGADDLGRVLAGDVLVCDAIQPMMTHVIPLAAAIVERRGGMLIHGSIIARELGIPCVNGIPGAVDRVPEGETATVDGHLGIVTIGAIDLREGPAP